MVGNKQPVFLRRPSQVEPEDMPDKDYWGSNIPLRNPLFPHLLRDLFWVLAILGFAISLHFTGGFAWLRSIFF